MTITPQEKIKIENEIKNNFSELQKKLSDLQNEIIKERDATKKQEKQEEFDKMKSELDEMKKLIDRLSSLQEQDLQSLKTRIEECMKVKQDTQSEATDLLRGKVPTPTTHEILKDSNTYTRLLNIIKSNPNEFIRLPGNTPEEKLEHMFSKIRESVVLFVKNKLGKAEKYDKIINNTIAPALEWSIMEMLRDQGNKENTSMLKGLDKISADGFQNLIEGVSNFATSSSGSFNKFSQWVNAIDYLSVHNGVLLNPEKSQVLTNPTEFKNYLNDSIFASENFSPYTPIDTNIFKVDENQTFEFGISLQEKQDILNQIGDIQVENNPQTISSITKILNKSEKIFSTSTGLQETANHLLDGVDAINGVTKMFGVDIIGEISKPPEERSFIYRILDFICKLIGVTGGLEGIVKRWRLDRLDLTDEKNENISQIFDKYQKLVGKGNDISITDENSCKTILSEFNLTDLDEQSTTKGDHLRDVMSENMNLDLISPSVVQQILGDDYIKKETITINGKPQEKIIVDSSKITDNQKRELAHKHIANMKKHFEENYNDLKDFYSEVHNIDDLVICITASLYSNKEDIVEGMEAKIFLPENYGVNYGEKPSGGNEEESGENYQSLSELTSAEQQEMQILISQSKTPNTINYLENVTYKKYLNIIERELNLPRYALECVCRAESQGKLYSGNNLLGSSAGTKGLFQFMPGTADIYMKHSQLAEKYGKTFTSRDEFLKDPLASARAAGIMYSEFMYKYNYNFQSSLACYNRGIGNYQKKFGSKNLDTGDLKKIPAETKGYVEKISKDVLEHNSATSDDVLLADLGNFSWARENGDGASLA